MRVLALIVGSVCMLRAGYFASRVQWDRGTFNLILGITLLFVWSQL